MTRSMQHLRPTDECLLLEMELAPEWKEGADFAAWAQEFSPRMEAHAVFASGFGVSWRKNSVQVGACGVGETENGMLVIVEGANYSPYMGIQKTCAEISSERMARRRGVSRMLGFWIVGPDDPGLQQHVNGLAAPTLHPCPDPCRKYLNESDIVLPDTLFTTFVARTGELERHTLAQFGGLYASVESPQSSHQELMGVHVSRGRFARPK